MRRIILILCLFILSLMPLAFTFAQSSSGNCGLNNFSFIVNFPRPAGAGIESGNNICAEDFVNILYALSISIAGLLAVVKIIYAGVKYMLTDVAPQKGDAKKDIWGAILGLVIVLAAVFMLEIINPQLSTINIFRDTPSVGTSGNWPNSAVTTPNGAGGAAAAGTVPANVINQATIQQCRNNGKTPIRLCTSAVGDPQTTTPIVSQTCVIECK